MIRLETLIDKWGKRSCRIIDKNTFIILEFLNSIKQEKNHSLTEAHTNDDTMNLVAIDELSYLSRNFIEKGKKISFIISFV